MQQRAAIYCRVSTAGQEGNGSLEDQEKRGRAWCAEHGYAVLEPPYREVYTGEELDRPQLDALREQVRAGQIDVVVVDKVDRLSRMDPAIAAYVMVEAEQYGAKVEFVEVQDDSFEGQILTAVLSIVARVEHRRIKERTVAGRRRRIVGDPANGKPARLMPGSVPRYGWRYADADKSHYVLHPEQAHIMERIYTELGVDGRSLNAICRDLEREGVVPPTEALAREGYAIGKRRTSMKWHPASVTRMLKEPCYWGEAVAYRYEGYKAEMRDAHTHRVRKVKRVRYRDSESDAFVRYPPEVWPGIVSRELAMKTLARLKTNQQIQVRQGKHAGDSFLRAGLVICGYCGAHMTMRNHMQRAGDPSVLRFICSRHIQYVAKHPTVTTDCPSGGLINVRVHEVEEAVWAGLTSHLSDPKRVPDAYAALTTRETGARERLERRTKTLTDLITKARQRLTRLADALADEDDPDMRALYKEKVATETANIRTWEQERKAVETEAEETLAETAEVREWIAEFLARAHSLLHYNTAQRRKLATALNLRVAVYKPDHQPWVEMACDLPGIEASWHAVPFAQAKSEQIAMLESWRAHMEKQGKPLPNIKLKARSPRLLIPVPDKTPQVSERVLSVAIPSRTA